MRRAIKTKTNVASLNGMKNTITGKFIAYSSAVYAGAIRTINGQRYTFFKKEWLGEAQPAPNMTVVFRPASNAALQVCAA